MVPFPVVFAVAEGGVRPLSGVVALPVGVGAVPVPFRAPGSGTSGVCPSCSYLCCCRRGGSCLLTSLRLRENGQQGKGTTIKRGDTGEPQKLGTHVTEFERNAKA